MIPGSSKVDGGQKFKEIWAISVDTGEKLAMALFPESATLDEVVFTPDTIIYNELLGWSRGGEQTELQFEGEIEFREVAKAVYFRQVLNRRETTRRVKAAIDYAVKGTFKGGLSQMPHSEYFTKLVRALTTDFPKVRNEQRVNYGELYRIFELVRRKNINLGQFIRDGELSPFIGKLEEGIREYVLPPSAMIRLRTKSEERRSYKATEVIYDIRTPGHQGGLKKWRDLYGIKVILPDIDDVNRFVKQLTEGQTSYGPQIYRENQGGKLETVGKDYIHRAKGTGYQSVHLFIEFSNAIFELQIKTHEMDYDAESRKDQSHDAVFQEVKDSLVTEKTGFYRLRRLMGLVLEGYNLDRAA